MDALRRIAFLLERAREETYRVKAYRGAADALAALPPAEVEQRAQAGTLTELKGVGPKTATVAEQALARGCRTTSPRSRPRPTGRSPTGGAAAAGRAARRPAHPLRLVRRWQPDRGDGADRARPRPRVRRAHRPLAAADGGQRALARAAARASSTWSPRSTSSSRRSGCSPASRSTSSTTARSTRRTSCSAGSTSWSPPCTRSCGWTPTPMTRRMVNAVANPHTDVLGHCTGRLVTGGRGTPRGVAFDAELVFAACERFGVAVEINSPPGAARPAAPAADAWRSRPAACSRSTPTRTRPDSWTGSPTAASGPRSAAYRPSGCEHPAGRRAAGLGGAARREWA